MKGDTEMIATQKCKAHAKVAVIITKTFGPVCATCKMNLLAGFQPGENAKPDSARFGGSK